MNNDINKDEKPPPIPRRVTNQSYYNNYGSPGMSNYNGLGNMYASPYQNMMYSNSGLGYGYRGSYGNENYGGGFEDITSNAFQSIGNVVQAVTSVGMMMESMLFATQNSVRALASVAEQFSHLKLHIITTAASFLRTLRYYIRKFMAIFSLKGRTQVETECLEDVFQQSSSSHSGSNNQNMAIILFYALVFATPVIMWQLLRTITSDQSNQRNEWHKGLGEHFLAESKFDFTAENNDELSFQRGDILRIAPKNLQANVRGWILASDGEKRGLVPANYIKVLGKNRQQTVASQPITAKLNLDNTVAPAARELVENTTTSSSEKVTEIIDEEIS